MARSWALVAFGICTGASFASPTVHDECASTVSLLQVNHKIHPDSKLHTDTFPDPTLPDNEYFAAMRESILQSCGSACSYKDPVGPGKFFDTVIADDQCDTVFSSAVMRFDALSNRWPPPKDVPQAFLQDFKMGQEAFLQDFKMGQDVAVKPWFIEEKADSQDETWPADLVDKMVREFASGNYSDWFEAAGNFTQGSYGESETKMVHDLLLKHSAGIKGEHCVVIGSLSPWVEALLLAVGAAKVTTVEYTEIRSSHPQLNSILPSKWNVLYEQIKTGQERPLDCIVSYSSLEHAGLGRYGDIINPWGDLLTMAKARCTLKSNGLIFLGFETGVDTLVWNAHRRYGPLRWPQMLANTEQLDYGHPAQSLFQQGMVVARKF